VRALLVACVVALIAAWPAAAQLRFEGEPIQGGLVIGLASPGVTVMVAGKRVRLTDDGRFLIGLGRTAKPKIDVIVVAPSGERQAASLTVKRRTYKVSRIDGLPNVQVTPDPKALARIRADNAQIGRVRGIDGAQPDFTSGFVWPVIGRVSGVYGSQRILNGKPRSPHNGVDIAAPEGMPVAAMADGVVALVHPDMFFTGITVMIDHGFGLTSVYAHMRKATAQQGQRVVKGQVIGAVGKTGRATGPHLHWGVTLFATNLDPALLVGPMPSGR
jgi:murein DD-endopeptidase MepM/ murein hydrolase activator NlpD